MYIHILDILGVLGASYYLQQPVNKQITIFEQGLQPDHHRPLLQATGYAQYIKYIYLYVYMLAHPYKTGS